MKWMDVLSVGLITNLVGTASVSAINSKKG
jgi:hypothetical protein